MTAFPKYPKYKDSGLEWLGEVPYHWEISRSRRVFTQRKELARKDDQQLSATQAYGVIPQADYEERIGRHVVKISMHLEKRRHVEPDDFVISMRSFQGGLERAWARGAIRSSYTVLEPAIKVAPSYFAYLFKCPQYIGALQSTGNFIRDGQDLTYQNYILVDLPLPPLAEQERIGAFLDEKTAEIDRLIAKKQRQIELLDEQKAILINRAVTRGLHPQAELQDSGIPWIGPIPKHWKVIKLKYLISIQAGYAFASSAYSHDAQDIRLLRGVNVNPGKITWNDVVYWPEKKMRGVEDFALAEDDMVMGMDRPWVSSGVRVARITKEDLPCLLLQRVARIRATKIEPDFLERVLTGSGFKSYFEPILTGVSVPHISPDQIGGYTAAVPPQPEQKAICSFINQAEALCSKVKATEESQIKTLQTLRSTLIAHAVTGKIKV